MTINTTEVLNLPYRDKRISGTVTTIRYLKNVHFYIAFAKLKNSDHKLRLPQLQLLTVAFDFYEITQKLSYL